MKHNKFATYHDPVTSKTDEPESLFEEELDSDELYNGEDSERPERGIVVGCQQLNLRKNPSFDSEIRCVLMVGQEVIVNSDRGTTDFFYPVYTAAGIEGYCAKEYISLAEK